MTDVIAHRGASRLEPENTVAAFRRAVAVGAHGIELDVRRTLDGVLVVVHDPALEDGRLVAETAWGDHPAGVATLDAALDACAGAWVNVEIKDHLAHPDVLRALRPRDGRFLVSSFQLETIDGCHHLDPSVPTGWLTAAIEPGTVELLVERGHVAVHPWEPTITAAQVVECHDAGLAVIAWTCNDPERFAELVSWGVDGVVTDVPDVMSAVLRG